MWVVMHLSQGAEPDQWVQREQSPRGPTGQVLQSRRDACSQYDAVGSLLERLVDLIQWKTGFDQISEGETFAFTQYEIMGLQQVSWMVIVDATQGHHSLDEKICVERHVRTRADQPRRRVTASAAQHLDSSRNPV